MKYTENEVLVDFASYRHYWRGIPKIGKTTLFRDIILLAYGHQKYGLLISAGIETGYKALRRLYAKEAPTWSDFTEVVDDLVEHKEDNEFKTIGIDTVDELVNIASDEVLRIHQRQKNEKAQSLNAALGGYGQGHIKVANLINEQIHRLELAGYGLVFISHTKVKDIKEKGMEESYQQLTSNMESRFDSIFSKKADIIATLYLDKTAEDNKLLKTQRYIYFRGDSFVDAGSRFPGIPARVEMSAENYLKAFEEGVRSSLEENISEEELEKRKQKEIEKREESAKKYIEKAKTGDVESADTLKTAKDYQELIDQRISELDKESKNQKRAELKEKGIPSKYKEIEDIEVLKVILKVVSGE